MDYKNLVFKMLDFVSAFWIIFWLIIVISAVSYDPQMFLFMLLSFLLYTFPAIVYLSFRKRIHEKLSSRLAHFQKPDSLMQEEFTEHTALEEQTVGVDNAEYDMGYREVKSEDSPFALTPKLKLLLTLLAIFLAILAAWLFVSR